MFLLYLSLVKQKNSEEEVRFKRSVGSRVGSAARAYYTERTPPPLVPIPDQATVLRFLACRKLSHSQEIAPDSKRIPGRMIVL